MAMVGAVFSVIGSVVGAMGAMAQARAEQQRAEWEAQRLEEQASWAQAKGALDARRDIEEGSRAQAKARAAFAQGGIATTAGTPLLLQEELESEKIFNARVTMASAMMQRADMQNRAKATRWEGQIRAQAARNQAFASLLSGFSGAARGFSGGGSIGFG